MGFEESLVVYEFFENRYMDRNFRVSSISYTFYKELAYSTTDRFLIISADSEIWWSERSKSLDHGKK